MLNGFRKSAMGWPGYISGETLVNHYDDNCVVVVSTWAAIEDWIRWQNSEDRDRNEALIEDLLDQPTVYEVFDFRGSSD
jgi:heme-degrading monooxygenase HmoA